MSGLTLGLLSLDTLDLEVLRRSGTDREKRHAQRIEPVIAKPHFLLVTLVLCNAAATEALPIFLDRLANPVAAVLISITVVLIFGEIIPQAVCSRYGLAVGAYSAWFVRILMVLTCPISWPISKILDYTLGSHSTALFRRGQLKALVDAHAETEGLGGHLSADEISIIRGALDLTSKTAASCMTPLDKVFMLSVDGMLDQATLQAILESGHSRIPIHRGTDRKEIIGIVLVKELVQELLIGPSQDRVRPITELRMRSLPMLYADMALYDMLHLFETGRSHMALLARARNPHHHLTAAEAAGAFTEAPLDSKQPEQSAAECNGHPEHAEHMNGGMAEVLYAEDFAAEGDPVGIITLEDVVEELLQSEIVDETDRFVDVAASQRVNAALIMRNLPPRLKMLIKSKSFLPRVGRLAALQSTSALQESLAHTTLTPRDSPTHGRSPRHRHELQQDGNVTEQNLLQAIDLLKPLLETQERPSSSPRRQ
ncbi:hypothetical protein WJX84_001723 [Apatococcus fuscideae]|uniref:CNNM transmembrane domain-containing protein n=1 Tax=Apatococcus fuscideae TaxID=2026836 RepID=A0AAW1TIE1_9CHLO